MTDPRLETLRARIEESIGGRRAALGFAKKHTGVSYRTLQNWIDGLSWPDAQELFWLAGATERPISFFVPTGGLPIPPEPAIITIPVLDVSAAAGSGRTQDVISAVDSFPFPRAFLARLAPPDAKFASLRCAGHSMEPTITDGAILIIDERQNTLPPPHPSYRKSPRFRPKPDGIYVFFHSEDLRLKRLRALDEGLVAIYSDNHAEHPLEITKPGRDGAFIILGKVIWWDNRL